MENKNRDERSQALGTSRAGATIKGKKEGAPRGGMVQTKITVAVTRIYSWDQVL